MLLYTIIARGVRGLVPLLFVMLMACPSKRGSQSPNASDSDLTASPNDLVADPPKVWPSPPPPSAPHAVRFPTPDRFELSNGLVVYVVENHEAPIVTTDLLVRCGKIDGRYLAALTANMLGEGTQSRSKAQLDEAIEFVGGSFVADAGRHVSTFRARSLTQDLSLMLRLMADQIQQPLFSPTALAKRKQFAKSQLRAERAQADALADTLFEMMAYPVGHPYGRPLATDSEIDEITVDALRQFHRTFYRANNSILIVSGDITRDQAQPIVESVWGKWTPAKPSALPPNPLNPFTRYQLPGELVVHLVDRPNSAQSTIRVGNIAVARNHEDWTALEVANQILGGGPSARLFQDIREEKSLTYSIDSQVHMGQAPGTFVIATETRAPTTAQMLAAIFEHIARMRTTDPSRDEFEATIRELVGSFPLAVETPQQIVHKLREQLIYDLPEGYWSRYRDMLTRVQLAEIRRSALRYIHALPVVVVVGDSTAIRPQLKQLLPSARIVDYDDQLQRR